MVEQRIPPTQLDDPPSPDDDTPEDTSGEPEDSGGVLLTQAEWSELQDCGMALFAAIHKCNALEGDEPAELVKCVQVRLEQALLKISHRLWPE